MNIERAMPGNFVNTFCVELREDVLYYVRCLHIHFIHLHIFDFTQLVYLNLNQMLL